MTPPLSRSHFPDGQLTVAVFGPGTGESQLIRFPDGSFGVIDGCRAHKASADPIAELLKQGPPPRLRFVCLTHAHEDHFGGLLDIIQDHAPELLLWAGTEGDRFRDHFVEAVRREQVGKPHPADPNELKTLINTLAAKTQRRPRKKPGSRPIVLSDHKLVLRLDDDVRVWGVLPTTTSLHRALGEGKYKIKEEDIEPRAERGDPNDISGALLVEWQGARVLLGGDALRGRAEHHEGWASASWIDGPAQLVKVAHHASSGAHDSGLWDRLRPAIAVVTPYKSAAGKQPPREEQLVRLLQTSRVFLTAPPDWWPDRQHLEGFEDVRAPSTHGTPLAALEGAHAHAPRAGTRDPYSAVAVTLDRWGDVLAVTCAGEARELTRRGGHGSKT